ncbi:MAG: serine/threonine-protein kinase, partial [Pirellulaceae bacterium]|nr:serine/threonine-protein kinase [Pirellulaceae bacterium]
MIDGASFFFNPQDPVRKGHPPFSSGSEAYAYPLLNSEKKKTAFFKIFREHSALRQERTEFLAGLNLPDLSAVLWASPSRWMDIQEDGYLKDPGTDRNFCGSFMHAVPGFEWRDLKFNIHESTLVLEAPFRLRCIQDLLLGLCVLKEKEMLHGDLSPGNIIINPRAKTNEPALYLIDFDAFVRPLTRAEWKTWFHRDYDNWQRHRSDPDPEIAADAQHRVQQLDELVAFIRGAVSGEASKDEQRHWLTGEYGKWRSRQAHPDADISREAHTRMDQVSDLLARLDGGEFQPMSRCSFMPINEGGTFGTSGYRPPELEAKADDDPTKHPFSDRFGRDMLLAELLLYDVGMGPSSTPTDWDTDVFYRQCALAVESYEASTNISQLVDYLERDDFLTIPERDRLTSRELADMLLAPQRPALVPPIARALQHEPRKSWRRQESETTQETQTTEKPARRRKTMAWLAAGIVAALALIFGSINLLDLAGP